MVNHVKAFLVREFGKNLIFKFSLFAISSASVWYRAICSIVDSLVSPSNLVNLETFHPLEISVWKTYSVKGDTKFGLCNPAFKPFWARMVLTIWDRLFRPFKLSCWTFLTTSYASWSLPTMTTPGLAQTNLSPATTGCPIGRGSSCCCYPRLILTHQLSGISIGLTSATWGIESVWAWRALKKSAIRPIWLANNW